MITLDAALGSSHGKVPVYPLLVGMEQYLFFHIENM